MVQIKNPLVTPIHTLGENDEKTRLSLTEDAYERAVEMGAFYDINYKW